MLYYLLLYMYYVVGYLLVECNIINYHYIIFILTNNIVTPLFYYGSKMYK